MAARHAMGFVYVLRNPAMAGMVKIGRTMRLSEDRAEELGSTGVPLPFEVVFRVASSRVKELELAVHRRLSEHRVSPRREFFQISEPAAIDAVRTAKAEVDGITAWPRNEIVGLVAGDQISLSLRNGQFFVVSAHPTPTASAAEILDLWQVHSDDDTLELYTKGDAALPAGLSDNDPQGDTDPVPYLDRDHSVSNEAIIGRERLVPGDRLLWVDSPHGTVRYATTFEAADWCHVVARTHEPQLSPEGWPLLLNVFTREGVTESERTSVKSALRLPRPRSWASRHNPTLGDSWAPVAPRASTPEHWLAQLGAKRQRKRSA